MIIPPNPDPPEVMHVDLNSAFAMTEQQANPFLRGRPVGVTNRLNDYAMCIAASHEAKSKNIRLGTRNGEARLIDPRFVMLESDSDKYSYVHKRMKAIFESYSPVAYMKSVDEGVIDFRGMRTILKGRPLEDIAREIKQRVREEIGDYMKVNVGIGQNRWLAKVAAGYLRPDGLFTVRGEDLGAFYQTMQLTDLPYIKHRNAARLYDVNIYTPYEFFQAPYWVLFRRVFKSVEGHHWYLKLRGYETEKQFGIRTVGRNYVLEHRTADPVELATLFHKAAVKIARRLRKNDLAARGLALQLGYMVPRGYKGHRWGWSDRNMWHEPVRRGDQLFERAMELFGRSPAGEVVKSLVMTAYGVEPFRYDQPSLFNDDNQRRERLEDAINSINDEFGELVVAPATVKMSKNPMKDKIPFGTVRYFE